MSSNYCEVERAISQYFGDSTPEANALRAASRHEWAGVQVAKCNGAEPKLVETLSASTATHAKNGGDLAPCTQQYGSGVVVEACTGILQQTVR
jgi:hypothetical protein